MNTDSSFAEASANLSSLCESCQQTLTLHNTGRASFLDSRGDPECRNECQMCVQLRYKRGGQIRVPIKTRGQISLGPFDPQQVGDVFGFFWEPFLRTPSLFSRRVSLCALYVINVNGQLGKLMLVCQILIYEDR
jgi:hypothetical protein